MKDFFIIYQKEWFIIYHTIKTEDGICKYSLKLKQNKKCEKYREFETMLTLTLWNKKTVKVVDFIFDNQAKLQEINSEIEKEKLKKYIDTVIDDSKFIRY